MNRIEEKLNHNKTKALITYITAGLPDLETTKKLVKAQQAGGVDVIELGVPFSYEAIQNGATLKKIFKCMEEMRSEGVTVPIIFMMYYNTILHYGIKEFADKCKNAGVDGLIVPDLPFEEQDELADALGDDGKTILIQLVSPVSGDRIPMILENARGFVYCVSSMGVTGQAGGFHKEVRRYLEYVKSVSKIPVMMGFGIKSAADVEPLMDTIDGVIVGSHFINLMRDSNFDENAAKQYCKEFKQELIR